MPKTPEKEQKRPAHRDMPEDPRELAEAMFRHGDKQMREKRAAEKPAAQDRPFTPRQRTA